jgi:hypothetical protein
MGYVRVLELEALAVAPARADACEEAKREERHQSRPRSSPRMPSHPAPGLPLGFLAGSSVACQDLMPPERLRPRVEVRCAVLQIGTDKLPLEGLGNRFAIALKIHEPLGDCGESGKVIRGERISLHDGEVDLDLF